MQIAASAGNLKQPEDFGRPAINGKHYAALPDHEEDGLVTVHAVQTILAQPMALYRFWRDIGSIPAWQEHVVSVTPRGERMSHWVMGDPEERDGTRVEFDSEIVEDVPGEKIAWRSITPAVEQSGVVTFQTAAANRGTLVTLIQMVRVPAGAGAVGNALAGVIQRSPKQTVIEDLRHFKQMVEAGEIPSVKGQPHGPRGVSGGFKEWLYGETNPTPPGTSEEA